MDKLLWDFGPKTSEAPKKRKIPLKWKFHFDLERKGLITFCSREQAWLGAFFLFLKLDHDWKTLFCSYTFFITIVTYFAHILYFLRAIQIRRHCDTSENNNHVFNFFSLTQFYIFWVRYSRFFIVEKVKSLASSIFAWCHSISCSSDIQFHVNRVYTRVFVMIKVWLDVERTLQMEVFNFCR